MISIEKIEPSPNVIARQVGDETVLLDIASGMYFGLDPVGARIWQLIEDGHGVSTIVTTMLDEFDVERAQLEADIARLIADLKDKQLVTAT